MLNDKMERELAYIVQVDAVEPIEGYDKIAYATVGGWHCVVSVDMKAGDKAIYFEIDSLLPAEDQRFAFCEKYKYKVKTQKYCKGTKISQGLLLPLTEFPEFADKPVGTFVTNDLKVTYYDPMDLARKSSGDSKPTYKPFFNKIKKHFPCKQLLRTEIGRKILFKIFGVKKKKKRWPEFVPKTDEERIQNMPWILQDKELWEVSEKIDGCSSTFAARRNKFGKIEFWICSRNVVLTRKSKTYYDDNVWFEMYDRYHVEEFLKDFLKETGADWVYLQGESFGQGIQRRDYSLKDPKHDFRAFSLCTSKRVRYTYDQMRMLLEPYGIPTVPIKMTNYILPDTVDELVEYAAGASEIDGLPREGIVLRKVSDPTVSFKAVDPQFLLKYH